MSRTIRALSRPKVGTLLGWAAAEGWNPGLDDAEPFHAADPEGFLGAFVDGEMVAAISAVRYGESYGFIGLYICRPDRRGQGHGKAVWDAGIARLAGRTVGLDGVPAQQANYARMGFATAYGTVRMSGVFPGSAGDDRVTPIDAELLPQVLALDARSFLAPRGAFLESWLSPPRLALALLEAGRVRGYGVLRACVEGHKIGPLFAVDESTALSLARALAAKANGTIHIDVPASQAGFLGTLAAAGWTAGFETARMYLGPAPEIAMARVFATTSLELG